MAEFSADSIEKELTDVLSSGILRQFYKLADVKVVVNHDLYHLFIAFIRVK
jgi:hypothetical protein